jgi:hypothetical protein
MNLTINENQKSKVIYAICFKWRMLGVAYVYNYDSNRVNRPRKTAPDENRVKR